MRISSKNNRNASGKIEAYDKNIKNSRKVVGSITLKEALLHEQISKKYLLKQKIRLASARKIKRQDQIEKLMRFIDVKLDKTVGIIKAKNELIDCQLCSGA